MGFLNKKGFTLVETLVVIAIMATLTAIALPIFYTWTRNLRPKEAAWDIASQLKLGRQLSITNNLEHRVEFNIGGRQYRLTQGNLPSGSTAWTVVKPWTPLDANINWATGTGCGASASINVVLNPNGSSDSGTVCVKDADNAVKFRVNISPTNGRVYIN